MTKILISAQGTVGDLVALLRVGSILNAGGDSVTLVTHCAYEKRVRDAGLDYIASDTPDEFERYLQDIALCATPRGNIEFQKRHVLPMAEREWALLGEQCGDPATVLIGSHMLMLGPQFTAEKKGLPLIRLFAAPVMLPRLFLFEMMCRDALAGEINSLRSRHGLAPVTDWAAWVRYPQLNLGAWPAWFAAPEPDWPEGLGLVMPGFLTMEETGDHEIPEELELFLREGEAPILITGGTGPYLKKGFYEVCLEAIQASGRRAILATRFREGLPATLPEQVRWYAHLSFAAVLPRVAAIIHHGGMCTLSLALRAGTPQLVLANGSDRPDNARRLQQLGVSEWLAPAHWSTERLVAALDQLIEAPQVRQACQAILQRTRGDDAAAAVRNLVHQIGTNLPAQAGETHG